MTRRDALQVLHQALLWAVRKHEDTEEVRPETSSAAATTSLPIEARENIGPRDSRGMYGEPLSLLARSPVPAFPDEDRLAASIFNILAFLQQQHMRAETRVEAHTGGDGEPPRKLRKMLDAKPKPSASKPPGPPEQPLPPPPGPPPPGPPPFSPPPMPPPKIPCPPWRGVKKEPVVKQELPAELDVVDQWRPSQWDTSQWSDSGDSSQWSAGADWGSHWDGSDDSTQWGGSGGDSASAAGWRGSGNAPASGSESANVPAGLGQKPKHLPDPTPDYEAGSS